MKKKSIEVILVMTLILTTGVGCGSKTAVVDTTVTDNTTEDAVVEEEPVVEEEVKEFVIDDNYLDYVSLGDIDGDGVEDCVTVTLTNEDNYFDETHGDTLNIWFDGEKIYEYVDYLPIYSIYDNFKYVDLDEDGKEELFITFEPMVNSMPMVEYLVLKEINSEWTAINLDNGQATLDGNDNLTNSFPIRVKRTGNEPVFEISCDGYDDVISYDASGHYEGMAEASRDNDYEHNVYLGLLNGDESLTDVALEDGRASAWGIWEIDVAEYEGKTCLMAQQGIEGPYGKFDHFGELYIYFDFTSNGKSNIRNIRFERYKTQYEEENEGFSVSLISDEVFDRIYGKSYKEDCFVPREELRYLNVLYKDLEGTTQQGELIVNAYIADTVLEIFKELYAANYPFERIRLVDEYDADDDLSILDNNTSAFNFRCIGSSNKISKHGLGLAIDINPFYNPYIKIVNGEEIVDPESAAEYADRSKDFDYKIDEEDLLYQLFTAKGFVWGGHWKNTKDYQHFEVKTETAKSLYPQWGN